MLLNKGDDVCCYSCQTTFAVLNPKSAINAQNFLSGFKMLTERKNIYSSATYCNNN